MAGKALIAMSGGVDSSVAAWLMISGGYQCTGAMMKLYAGETACTAPSRSCCSLEDAADARAVSYRLGMPFYVFNFTDCFEEAVIQRFIQAYSKGLTPNPCIDCNRYLKFQRFLTRAEEIGHDCIATGHYARIEYEPGSQRYLLKKGADPDKDQSYVLYAMTQAQLGRTHFPLGALHKAQVREIALEQGFVNAAKRDSQDICFAPDGDYGGFIKKHTGQGFEAGRFVDLQGRDLGAHRGIAYYTVGQRKGLGLSMPEPRYVCDIRPESNTVVVGGRENLFAKALHAEDINLIACQELKGPLRVGAKIRYRQAEQPATVWQTGADTLRIEFDAPQRAITKGQAVVLYDGDTVVGGGTIA